MTPEERDRISRSHPMWPVFEAYYARRPGRWHRIVAAAAVLVVLVVLLVLTGGATLRA